MKKLICLLCALCLAATISFGQANNATLTGTVTDTTNAVLPGVTITATNTATGVASTIVTNEAGAYTIQSLLPGAYEVKAELPGFQIQNYTGVNLGNAVTIRLNFSLQVAGQAQSVEVTVAADTLFATSSPTIGQVLTGNKVSSLPIVGNNVLDMLNIIGGLDNLVATSANPSAANAFGREGATLAGVSAGFIPVLRDGVMVQDLRYPTGINTATVVNPDLVGEVRVMVAPVDAEFGRGNGAVQISTRSGTNQFHGAGVWNLQNSATNANTWIRNRSGLPKDFFNNNQATGSIGGPIIKNRTFFYGLFDLNVNRQRANTFATVLTPCARNGVFRYFDGWNSAAVGAPTTFGVNPTTTVVDLSGNPAAPKTNPDGTPYTGQLRHVSVFGPVAFPAGGPNADCSNGTVNGSFDQFRKGPDATGLISRTIALMPQPNDFTNANGQLTTVDGLNVASFRFVRRFKGLDNLFGVGEATGDRKQYNGRIDHKFDQRNKASFNFSYERVTSDDTVAGLPDTFSNQNFRRPLVLNANALSTLSATLVNEFRFGFSRTGTNVVAPWDLPENQDAINKFLPANVNGFRVLPDITGALGLCNPITGARPPGNCLGANPAGNNITTTATDRTILWTWGDTLSWTKAKHTFKLGGEFRFASSATKGSTFGGFFSNFKAPAVVVSGAAPGAPLAVTGSTAIANSNPSFPGLGANDAARARNLLNFLSGSLSSINNLYFLTDPAAGTFSDFRTNEFVQNKIKQREISFFFKDDWKARKDLTLNFGLRWEYYGVPFSPDGLTAAPAGGSGAAFGYSGRDFTTWMVPGPRRADDLVSQFVGPNSPNEDVSVYDEDTNNFGPAVGFAWTPKFLGEGKTTVRGGYQITYQGGSRFNTLEAPLTFPPGRIFAGTFTGDSTNRFLDLTTLSNPNVLPTPLPPGVAPVTPIPITSRTQTISVISDDYPSPYVQNLTLSVTRSIRSNLSLDLRYIGTLGKKTFTTINLNSPNFLFNGLLDEFTKIRTGQESTMLDTMLNGVNICATGCTAGVPFGAIGSVVGGVKQTAALQMRASTPFRNNLVNGNFAAAASSLATLNYFKVGCPGAGSNGNCGLPDINTSVVSGAALRVNQTPENFILTNPQFATVNYLSNSGSNNYHSLQAEMTLRPTGGFSGTANYTWSRNLGVGGAFTNPVDRGADYTIVNNNHDHVLRTNGNIDLPIGPGQALFRNSSGVLARAIEGWRLGGIFTLSSGNWSNITAQNTLYANGVPDIVNAGLFKELLDDADVRFGIPLLGSSLTEGSFFDPAKYAKVPDPQCSTVSSELLTGSTRCLLQAVARIVPGGTPGSVGLDDGSGNSGLIILQNPQPGQRGNLGRNVLKGPSIWRFDANLEKSLKIAEGKNLRFRADVFNVLNHPQPANPNLSINPNLITGAPIPFGQITQKNGNRTFQGQLRLQF
jgi:hypothetical protein